ncbi:hypothetical protein Ssi02_12230 [Sinosporangium siamense]|uniref:Uncharacterized protein n=1 Tax=Sinosporangium siamense TaxID=1367973 RepID=A0A919V6H7_9ACTN|nr:hypothetical protein Ssi02_12230 [Sinosporangium siamense]
MLVSSCSTVTTARGCVPAPTPTTIDLTLLRAQIGDYDAAHSPQELVKKFDHRAIVLGEVEAYAQGHDVHELEGAEPSRHVVMRVRVIDAIRPGGFVTDGRVYVDFWQGGMQGSTGLPRSPLERWRAGIPAGTKIMLFLHEDLAAGRGRVKNPRAGLPPGAKLAAVGAQGVFFETAGGVVGGMDDLYGDGWNCLKSLDELRTAVKRAIASAPGG